MLAPAAPQPSQSPQQGQPQPATSMVPQVQQDMAAQPQQQIPQRVMEIDQQLSQLPDDVIQQFETAMVTYPDLPELLAIPYPETYDYFMLVQQAAQKKAQQSAPTQDSPSTGNTPTPPAGTGPLLGAQPTAKATSLLGTPESL